MANALVIGSLDTKSDEVAYVVEHLRARGVSATVVDAGVLGEPGITADISREKVARAGGVELTDLVAEHDRGTALTVMSKGLEAIVRELHRDGAIDAAIALGGTGGTSVAAPALRALPLGVPKVIVSTAASGDTSAYVAETDLVLFPSVADIAGLNRISRPILRNAANALAGMALHAAHPVESSDDRPLVVASMFGVTTPAVTLAKSVLEEQGYEVLVFHMTGSGGRSMEALIRQGLIAGVFDLTTTELADHLAGGVFDAGSARLTAAGATGIPQVVSVGALDMVNFGPPETVPAKYADRLFYQHNPTVTLMRTTPEENRQLGSDLSRKLSVGSGPRVVFLPLRGVSAIDTPGNPFHDPAADDALFSAIREGLKDSAVELVEMDVDVNNPDFVHAMVQRLIELINGTRASIVPEDQSPTIRETQ